ncbi:hypothetical protein [Aquipseudomonas alcaligenes]|uniref:Uncharacterized protein n=1 Tax=Aquipseudomonas alcaligenes (strain ATCC 14909 / DSM 50342 / CCUG 1425 / JCM 20561 / NBRC 14159 / NCIMB 9945 / NCTC 10367 / 1577) TaxID=1215092 RepID=U2Z2L9_AQUA1|nr:hypothetical protein [Pseudomonas alcaligenes]GAD62006.1 hypothetical protein PA6_009_00090 [Pseudomonas alcaligenes NBRC 14159]SUD16374.1 Uncharacterised protein [Pseudomonas alcaligenes]
MHDLRFSRTFSLLQQEGHLARTSLLSGIDLLLKANLDEKNVGKFYSAFFQLTIGIERILKLVVITNHMLENSYKPPTDDELKKKYGHNIKATYFHALSVHDKWAHQKASTPATGSIEEKILDFLQDFANKARYYNLRELSNTTAARGPLGDWYSICKKIAGTEIGHVKLNKHAERLMHQMDQAGMVGYSPRFDFDGHPMTLFDDYWRMHLIQMSAPHLVWKLVQLITPLYNSLRYITYEAMNYEDTEQFKLPVIPHLYEFFVFALATKSDTLRRKSWTRIFLD